MHALNESHISHFPGKQSDENNEGDETIPNDFPEAFQEKTESSDSESYNQPSGDDSDWNPGEESEDEDVKELLTEARGFLRNKKMAKTA